MDLRTATADARPPVRRYKPEKLRVQPETDELICVRLRVIDAVVAGADLGAPAGEERGLDTLYDKGVRRGAVIVAHPDDETLWAGGTILMNPRVTWTVVTLCRGDDPDRAPRFYQAMQLLGVRGAMGSLDDGPDQSPMPQEDVRETVLSLLPQQHFDLILTHDTHGEYTRHRRHEETARAVAALLADGKLSTGRAWSFAYEDGGASYLPQAVRSADAALDLPQDVWQRKYDIITVAYGFAPDSFEARTTPRTEAFRRLQIDTMQTEASS